MPMWRSFHIIFTTIDLVRFLTDAITEFFSLFRFDILLPFHTESYNEEGLDIEPHYC